MRKYNALIAGSTGYIGIQLLKLLIKHKNINIKFLCGKTSIGKRVYYFDKSLRTKKLPKVTKFKKEYLKGVDIIFTALPHGEAQEISNFLLPHNTLIDLAADFRLEKSSEYAKWYKKKHKSASNIKKSIYALPEISKLKVKNYKIIGCPGCYPTSVLLPIIPLLIKKIINKNNIIIDSKSGYSGAGRGVYKKYRNQNLFESLSAYGVGFHRHNSEIGQELNKYGKSEVKFFFTPHLSPMFRGILSTIYLDLHKNYSTKHVHQTLKKFYANEKFVKILKINSLLSTNDTIGTNYCYISVCKTKFKNKVIILCAIDNLIKGGAGQAIQNMNIKFNFDKDEGLK